MRSRGSACSRDFIFSQIDSFIIIPSNIYALPCRKSLTDIPRNLEFSPIIFKNKAIHRRIRKSYI